MKSFVYVIAAILALSVMFTATGCVKRTVYIKDNTTHPVVLMDQIKVGVLSGMVYKYIYNVCHDTGDSLECTPVCDGDSDYKCPSMFNGQFPWARYATNARAPMAVTSSAAPAPVEEAPVAEEGEEVAE